MSEIVNAQIIKACLPADSSPRPFHVYEMTTIAATDDHIRVAQNAGDAAQYFDRSFIQNNILLAGFGVWQPQQALLEVHLVPSELRDFGTILPLSG